MCEWGGGEYLGCLIKQTDFPLSDCCRNSWCHSEKAKGGQMFRVEPVTFGGSVLCSPSLFREKTTRRQDVDNQFGGAYSTSKYWKHPVWQALTTMSLTCPLKVMLSYDRKSTGRKKTRQNHMTGPTMESCTGRLTVRRESRESICGRMLTEVSEVGRVGVLSSAHAGSCERKQISSEPSATLSSSASVSPSLTAPPPTQQRFKVMQRT